LCLLWFIFSILGAGAFNGWTKISVLSGFGFCIFLSIIESIMYLVACGLGILNLVKALKLQDENPFKEEIQNHQVPHTENINASPNSKDEI